MSDPSTAFSAMQNFAKEHAGATKLLHIATYDYAAARCLLLNGLVTPGLTSGAQAIEKFLKSYLLLSQPGLNVKGGFSHALSKLLSEVARRFPSLNLSQYTATITRFEQHYSARYPDNPSYLTSRNSGEVNDLDQFVICLNEHLPCPLTIKMRTGLYAAITFSLGIAQTITPTERWIKANNQALAPLLPRIEADYRKVLMELYPDQKLSTMCHKG